MPTRLHTVRNSIYYGYDVMLSLDDSDEQKTTVVSRRKSVVYTRTKYARGPTQYTDSSTFFIVVDGLPAGELVPSKRSRPAKEITFELPSLPSRNPSSILLTQHRQRYVR